MGQTVAILGGGQLGKMLCLAGAAQGVQFKVLEPADRPPASVCAEHIKGAYDDPAKLEELIQGSSVLTYEFENVPAAAAAILEGRIRTYPPARALEAAQDRLSEKLLFTELGIPVPRYAAVDSFDDLKKGLDAVGLPAVLKTRRLGYDGKGQVVIEHAGSAQEAFEALGGRSLILEEFVRFDYEASALAVRAQDGEKLHYPLVWNVHREGILRLSSPCLGQTLTERASPYVNRLLDHLKYVGVLALELFVRGNDVLANEMAPRVHNSGHWTIEGAETSQFENHLRACLGWPLGSAARCGRSIMLNIIGALPDLRLVRAIPGAHVHLYGKEPRPGRKIGHITLWASDEEELEDRLSVLACVIPEAKLYRGKP